MPSRNEPLNDTYLTEKVWFLSDSKCYTCGSFTMSKCPNIMTVHSFCSFTMLPQCHMLILFYHIDIHKMSQVEQSQRNSTVLLTHFTLSEITSNLRKSY